MLWQQMFFDAAARCCKSNGLSLMRWEEQESTMAEWILTKYFYQILQRNSEYVALVLKYKLGECWQSLTEKRWVGINFVSPQQGRVGQMCQHLAVGATCRRHVGNFPSQDYPFRPNRRIPFHLTMWQQVHNGCNPHQCKLHFLQDNEEQNGRWN